MTTQEKRRYFYRIDEIKTDARVPVSRPHARLIVYVSFWLSKADHDAGKLPQWREGFYMDVPPAVTRVVTNPQGHLKRQSDGQFVDPATIKPGDRTKWERETVTCDVPSLVHENIARYLARQPNKTGAHFDAAARPSSADTKSILSRNNVQALKGVGREVQ